LARQTPRRPPRFAAFCYTPLTTTNTTLPLSLSYPSQELTEEVVEALRSDEAVDTLLATLRASFPELVPPLLAERDLYLAWSMKRSKAVNGVRRVVGVVGKGHLRGVAYALAADAGGSGLKFSDLVDGRNSRADKERRRRESATRLAAEAALGAGLWAAWAVATGELPLPGAGGGPPG
jgi:hypothetical protein